MSRIDTLISLPKNLLALILVSQLTTLDCFGQNEIEFTTIGNQSWTSKNFSGVTFRNGDTIEESTTASRESIYRITSTSFATNSTVGTSVNTYSTGYPLQLLNATSNLRGNQKT